MEKNLLEYLKSESKKFRDNQLFDIVLYGSSVKSKEEPRDIDILMVFKEKSLNERLEIAHSFKQKIKKKIKNPDVKTINLIELFDSNFSARQGIFTEGYSLIDNLPFSLKIGFRGFALFTYSLKNLSHNEKTRFTYSLIGRNDEGMIKKTNALPLGKGALIVPIEKSIMFEDFLNQWKVNYKMKYALILE